MTISVYAFGTGGKRKRMLRDIYFSIEEAEGVGVLYTKTGEYSAVLRMENPVQKYSADIDSFYEFDRLMTAVMASLGEGYALHKQDIFVRRKFDAESDRDAFLSKSYFRYFHGREYIDSSTYLTITQENRKSALLSYDSKKWRDFLLKIRKVHDLLKDGGVEVHILGKKEADEYISRFYALNFKDGTLSMNNLKADSEQLSMGDKVCKTYSLVDVVMLLDQSKFRERFDEIKAVLGLTDVDCSKIFTINRLDNKDGRNFFREVFIRRGSVSGVYGVEESHECYMTYTTERAEKEALKLYKSQIGCSHEQAIARYCADWAASGLTNPLPFARKVIQSGKVLSLSGKGCGSNESCD